MVFRKYKAVTHFSKNNTRIFKEILAAKNARKMPKFQIPEALQNLDIEIHDPNKVSFVNNNNPLLEKFKHMKLNEMNIPKESIKDHPLYKETPCILFESEEPFSDGIDQACNLTNAIPRTQFPDLFENAINKINIPENFENEVIDSILAGERYDPTIEKLPRRFDPIIFWVTHPRVYGTPVIKRGNIILENLFRKFHMLSLIGGGPNDTRCDLDEPLSGVLNLNNHFDGKPLVVRGCPHITLQNSIPPKIWTPLEKVKETVNESVPALRAIEATLDLRSENIYNDQSVVVRQHFPLFINTIMYSMEKDQKYPWTSEQRGANVIMNCFGAALAQVGRNKTPMVSFDEMEENLQKNPIVTKAVQLCDGRLDIAAFQLNTLQLNGNGIKNEVWLKRNLQLYKTKPFWENMDTVEELNMETVKDLARVVLC